MDYANDAYIAVKESEYVTFLAKIEEEQGIELKRERETLVSRVSKLKHMTKPEVDFIFSTWMMEIRERYKNG